MNKTIEIQFPGTDWESLTLKTKNKVTKSLSFFSKDKKNDVEINYEYDNMCLTMFLNQEQIKATIQFLQKQITQE